MSSQGRSASSGVRNLRAMFENKDDSTTSPPQHRGRSPAPSIAGSNSASPRPLSKVRTSFVAVERNGQSGIQWGLRKETTSVPPEDSTMSHRRGSFVENEATDPDVVIERKKSIQAEFKARKNSIDVSETIPEFALEIQSNAASKQGTPTIEPKDPLPAVTNPAGNPDKPTSVEDRNAKLLPADTKSAAAVSGGKALKGASGVGEDLKGVTTGKLKTASSAKTSDKAAASKSSKPAPISTSKTSTLSKTSKSPALPKTPVSSTSAKSSTRTTTTAGASKTTKPTAEKTTTTRASTTTTKPAVPSTRTTAATKKPALPSSTGFIKPRPKSPTKPAKLPSSLTAPTSSSLSKLADDARRTSAGSTRSPSRVSASQKSEPVARKPTSSRPSLGPPPAVLKKQTSRQSLPKPSAPADEGFLARMMRPTTASASKTHDKAATPPKVKVMERPGTRNGQNAGAGGSPVAVARPPVPVVGAVPTLKALGAKGTAGKGKKSEVLVKKEGSATAEKVVSKPAEPVAAPAVEEKAEEPVVEAVSVPEPVASVDEQVAEPAVAEEAVEEEAAPVTTAEEAVPAQEEVEIDEPAPAVDIEEVEEAAPVEEAEVEAAAPVEEEIEETTEEAAEEPNEPAVETEDEPVVTDKVDVEAAIEGAEVENEEPVVNDKVDVAAVVEETAEDEPEAEAEAEIPVVVEAETETAAEAEETPAVVEENKAEAETETAVADEANEVVEPTSSTAAAAESAAEPETADVPATTAAEEKTTDAGDKTEKAEVEEVEHAEPARDVTTPVQSGTPVVAL